ncbi:MAG: CRTAC1 family protein, partial [Planctomycetota bacterium]
MHQAVAAWRPSRARRRFAAAAALPVAVLAATPAPGQAPFTEEAAARGLLYTIQSFPTAYGSNDGFGCGFADLDGDGDPDVVVLGADDATVGVFENDGTGHFADRSVDSGIAALPQGSALAFADYDGDGDLDLYLTQYELPNRLLRNDGSFAFTDVTELAGVGDAGPGTGACWGDYDGDGRLDLYLCNYLSFVSPSPNRLYRNLGGGVFEDVSVAQAVDDPGMGFQAVWFDYDRDGDVDLYLSNDRGHLPPYFRGNQLWRNDGGQLVNVSEASGTGLSLFSMGVACGDFDGNGWPDLYVTNIPGGGGFANNVLMLNQGDGTFLDWSEPAGVDLACCTSWGSIFFDYDNDRRTDLYVNTMWEDNALFVFDQSSEDGYPCLNIAAEVDLVGTECDVPFQCSTGVSFVAAVGDVDGDGDLDVLETNLGGNVQLYVNHEGQTRQWIGYRVVGLGENTSAVGALVETRVGTVTQMREVLAGGNGYLGQNDLTVHVGLGDAAAADEVTVRWPGGTPPRTLTALPADAVWTLYPPARLGDADGDGLRTADDFRVLQGCFGAPLAPG